MMKFRDKTDKLIWVNGIMWGLIEAILAIIISVVINLNIDVYDIISALTICVIWSIIIQVWFIPNDDIREKRKH